MQLIKINKLTPEELEKGGVFNWPVWEKEVSAFPWSYDSDEECWIIEGEAEIEVNGEKIRIKAGDFVTFKKGLTCTWTILSDIRKHYNFS